VILILLMISLWERRSEGDQEQEQDQEQEKYNTSTHHDASICSLLRTGTAV